MIDAFSLVDRLSTYTLGGLVTLILVCSYFRLWVWGSVVNELRADFERRLLEEKQAKQRWEDAALSAYGAAALIAKKPSS